MNIKHIATWGGLALLGLGLALAMTGAKGVRADGPNQVALIVVHGSETIKKCVEFEEDEISGYEVLERSNIDMKVEAGSDGAAVCSLDDKGCNYPEDDCFCKCQGNPCVYWSYWHLKDGAWQYSSKGASSFHVDGGDLEGWSWGEGEYGKSGTQPPATSFDDICNASGDPASGDYSPSVGAAPGSPTIDYFKVDRPSVAAGESVTLSWDLRDAKAAYLRVNGQDEGVVAPGTKVVAPTTTTEYVLIARNDAGEVQQKVTIEVNPASPTPPPPTDTPPPPPPPPTDTPLPPPPPTDTPEPPPTEAPPPPADTPPPAQPAAATEAPPTAVAVAVVRSPAAPVAGGPPTLTPTGTPAPVAATQPTPFIRIRRTPENLVRMPPAPAGPDIPLIALAVAGGLGIAGGLVGAGLLFAAARRAATAPRPDPRRRATPVRRSGGKR